MWWLWLLLIALAILLLSIVIRCVLGRSFLKRVQQDSLIIFGRKGKGKTLLFSEMSRNCRKSGYGSTTEFHHRGETKIDYNRINVEPNTWENVLEGKIVPIKKDEELEGKTIFLDDAGVYLPNFADNTLKKEYGSMPIAFAVWRHLYNAPAHINSQDVERAWKMVREQADGFILCRGCVRLFGLAFIRCTYYRKVQSAKEELAPMGIRLFNKFSKAEVDQYRALHGEIKDFLIFAPSWRNRYDSRYFHKVFFGIPAPKRKWRAKRWLEKNRKIREGIKRK